MPNNVSQKFTDDFFAYWNNNALDFNKLKAYLDKFVAEEKAAKKGLNPPAKKLQNYLNSLKEYVVDDKDLFYSNFESLLDDGKAITEFLDAYGYEHLDDPEIQALNSFYNEMQVFGMRYDAAQEYEFYQSFSANKKYLDAEEKKVFDQMIQFYADLALDGLKANELESNYEATKKNIEELEKKVQDSKQKLEDLKTIDEDIKDLTIKSINYNGLNDLEDSINIFTKYNNFFDINQNEGLLKADQSIKDLTDTQNKLKTEIDSHNQFIRDNIYADKEYQDNLLKITHMTEAKELANKGLTSDILDKRINGLNNAFGELSAINFRLDQTPFYMLKNNDELYKKYNDSKNYIINNFSDDPALTQTMKDMFKIIEKDGEVHALDLLVDHNMKAFNNNLKNLQLDKDKLKKYEDLNHKIAEGLKIHEEIEKSKKNIEACNKGLSDCTSSIDKLKKNNFEIRKTFFDSMEIDPQDIDTLSKMSNAEFSLEIKDMLDNYTSQKEEIINSKEYQELSNKRDEKIKLKEKFDKHSLEKNHIDDNVELDSQKAKLSKLEGHINKANSFQEKVDNITKMKDKLYKDMNMLDENTNNLKKPNRFDKLEKALTDIKAKFDKINKGSKNSPEFDDMYAHIDIAVAAAKTGDIDVAKLALETLDSKTQAYKEAKEKQTRWFPSTLRKLRLQTNEELHKICENREYLSENVHEMKKSFDDIAKNYKPGNSVQVGRELMSKAQKELNEHPTKYIKKISFDHGKENIAIDVPGLK